MGLRDGKGILEGGGDTGMIFFFFLISNYLISLCLVSSAVAVFVYCVLWGEGVWGEKFTFLMSEKIMSVMMKNGHSGNRVNSNKLNIFLHKYMSLAPFSYLVFGLFYVPDNFTEN